MLHHKRNVAKERQLLHADFFTVGYLFNKEQSCYFLWGNTLKLNIIIPPANEVWGVYRNHPVCLSVCLSVCSSVQSKLNLGYNFLTNWDKAFILHMWMPCEKTFLPVPKILTLWPWPWLLTYLCLKKKLNLGYNFWTKRDRAFIFHMCIFCAKTFLLETNIFNLVTLTLTFDLLLKKRNLDHNLWTRSDRVLILHTSIPCDKTFLLIPIFLT